MGIGLLMKINSYIKVKYIGNDNPLALRHGKVYEARVLKLNWYGIVDETNEEYAYPPELFEIVENQVKASLAEIEKDSIKNKVVIAYEPIWAIGTGKTATAEQANEMCKHIRSVVASMYDEETAECVRIQYGGSVKPANASEILNMSDIDGALVGGASLTNDFVAIVNY